MLLKLAHKHFTVYTVHTSKYYLYVFVHISDTVKLFMINFHPSFYFTTFGCFVSFFFCLCFSFYYLCAAVTFGETLSWRQLRTLLGWTSVMDPTWTFDAIIDSTDDGTQEVVASFSVCKHTSACWAVVWNCPSVWLTALWFVSGVWGMSVIYLEQLPLPNQLIGVHHSH